VRSPEYTFVDGGGRLRSFGDIETDGALALRATEPGARELIVIAPFTEVRFGEPLRSARALDEARRPLDEVALEPAHGQVVLKPVPNAVSYVVPPH
jgi:hypothetical protein